MRRQEHGSVLGLLRQGEELLAQGVSRLVRSTHVIISVQATHHREKLMRIFQGFTQVLSTRVGLSDFRSPSAFGGKQRCP